MARKKKPAADPQEADRKNVISAEDAEDYFARIDAIADRARTQAADARSDIKGVYEEMVENLDVTMEACKLLWARREAERKFITKSKKMEPADRRGMEMFAEAFGETPMGDWARQAAEAE